MNDRKEILANFRKFEQYTNDRVKTGIENNRKANFFVYLRDKDGNPVKGEAEAEQLTHEFKFGANVFMLDQFESDEKNALYRKYFSQLFNMATLPFYWSDVEPERGKPRFCKDSTPIYRRPPIDMCMEFCEQNNIQPREHGLAYEAFFPKWLKGASEAEMKAAYEKRCAEIAERYAGRIPTIEVTNEMWLGKYSVTPFYYSPDYIKWFFETTRKYFPENELAINDFAALNTFEHARTPYYLLVENALLKGAPIDAVGLQYHMFFRAEQEAEKTKNFYDPRFLFTLFDTFEKLGKPLQITEITIPAYTQAAEDEEIQAQIIKNLYSIWFSLPKMEQLVYWNLVDGYSWAAPMGDMEHGENYYRGGLLRFDLSPKPAYEMIKTLFCDTWHTKAHIDAKDGAACFKGFFGKYSLTVKTKDSIIKREVFLGKNSPRELTLEV